MLQRLCCDSGELYGSVFCGNAGMVPINKSGSGFSGSAAIAASRKSVGVAVVW